MSGDTNYNPPAGIHPSPLYRTVTSETSPGTTEATYQTRGTVSGPLVGAGTAPTVTFEYVVQGDTVTLSWQIINVVLCDGGEPLSVTAVLPAAIRPTSSTTAAGVWLGTLGSTYIQGPAIVSSAGTVSFEKQAAQGFFESTDLVVVHGGSMSYIKG